MIPNQLFINLTDLIFVDLSDNLLGKKKKLSIKKKNMVEFVHF